MHIPAEPRYIGKCVKWSSLRKKQHRESCIWHPTLAFGVEDSGVEGTVASGRICVLSKQGISDSSTVM